MSLGFSDSGVGGCNVRALGLGLWHGTDPPGVVCGTVLQRFLFGHRICRSKESYIKAFGPKDHTI